MMGRSFVATPSLSKRRQPVSPATRGRSVMFRNSGNSFCPSFPSRKEFFCWMAKPPRAFRMGVTSFPAHSESTMRLVRQLSVSTGKSAAAALSQAVRAQLSILRSLRKGAASHQKLE